MTTTATKEYTIRDIETLTEAQAAEMAIEAATVKGHQVYFVDFGGYFGYSVLVFADGHYIKYANDYELHHSGKSRDELRKFYLDSLNKKLFTADEMETVSDYQDKQAKEYYIRNYYGLRRDHISMFFCGPDKEREKLRRKTEKMIFSPVFLAFYDKKDADFVNSGEELLAMLEKAEPESDKPILTCVPLLVTVPASAIMRTSKSFSPPATLATYNGPHTWPRGANIASRAPNFTKWMVEQ